MTRSVVMMLRCGVLLFGIFAPLSSQAAFHQWDIVEVYSNSSGSVQFIELFTTAPSENVETGAQIRTDSGNTFNITGPLAGTTTNDRLLFATAGFYSLAGAPAVSATQPAYSLPANFFNPTSDRIRLFQPTFSEFEIKTINAVNPIPTDNVFARTYSGATTAIAANSPQARDVAAGSINRGDYNSDGVVDAADYVVYRKTLGDPASPLPGSGADGDTDGTIDPGDYALWRARFGNALALGIGSGSGAGAITVTPEPSTIVLAVVGLAGFGLFCMPCRVTRRSGRDPRHVDVRRKVRPSGN